MAASPQTRMQAPREGKPRAKSIGHYILGKTIGEGTFGKVKLGTHILTGERVAVKVLEKDRIVEVADVERVAREVHILKLIRHPHIVQLYEIIETRRQLYLIMEYASGGELFDYIVASGRVAEPEACRFFHQIIAGVEKIHLMNIVHRDLKPENLLLDEHKSIKIVDFGLSNVYRDGQLLKTACGSPCYAAPEMIAGHHYVPSLCDLWSCGVILFALVCGYLPFEDQNTAQLYKKILAADYKTPSFLSEAVKDLIAGMLTTDPTQRFVVQTIRAHPWYQLIPEASVVAQSCQTSLQGDVLQELDNFGFPRDYAVRCLELNKHNHVTTTYYLLAEKTRRFLDKVGKGSEVLQAFDIPEGITQTRSQDFQDFLLQARADEVQGEQRPELPEVPQLPHLPQPVEIPEPRDALIVTTQPSVSYEPHPAPEPQVPLPSPVVDRRAVSPRGYPPAAPVASTTRAPGASAVDSVRVHGATPRSPGHTQAAAALPWSPRESLRPQDPHSPARHTPQVHKAPPATPLPTTPHGVSSTATPYTRPSAAVPVTPIRFGKDSPPSPSPGPSGLSATIGAGTTSPLSSSARRSPATSAGTGPGASASLAVRASVGGSSTYNARPSTVARDLTRSTESTRRRAAIPEAPQSARARLGGRPPVPSSGAPTATTPRASPSAPMSARGERVASRAMSTSPTAVSARESLGRSVNVAPGNSRTAAMNAWSPGSSRTARVAMR